MLNNTLKFLCVLAVAVIPAHAQNVGEGSKIYIDGDKDFAIYLTAAIRQKHVNVVVTTDKVKADYVLEETSDHFRNKSFFGVLNPSIISDLTAPVYPQLVTRNDAASVRLVEIRTSDVVFAYALDRNNTLHGRQTAAESCAKHLKEAIHAGLKPVGSQGASLPHKIAAWPWKADPNDWAIY